MCDCFFVAVVMLNLKLAEFWFPLNRSKVSVSQTNMTIAAEQRQASLSRASCLVRGEKASLLVYNYYILATEDGFSQNENYPTSCECLEL